MSAALGQASEISTPWYAREVFMVITPIVRGVSRFRLVVVTGTIERAYWGGLCRGWTLIGLKARDGLVGSWLPLT